jgi:hypothetical protein
MLIDFLEVHPLEQMNLLVLVAVVGSLFAASID